MSKPSRFACVVRNNVLSRVRKDRARGIEIPCLDSESLARAIDSVVCRKGATPVCEHCDKFLRFGDKVVHAGSPSLHKIQPNLGYVTGNLAVICFECNTSIGESGDAESVRRKIAAMQWQLKKLEG